MDGATAVLVTHEHPDHYDLERLRGTDAPIFTIAAVAEKIAADAPDVAERVTVVVPGSTFDDPGVKVRVIGAQHAVIHRDLPPISNSGYLLTLGEQRVYHPGDALLAPDRSVDVLLAPSSAPWLRSEMAVDFVREVGAPRNLAIHDRIYTEAAHGILATQMGQLLPEGQEWIRRADGEDL